MRNHLDGGGWHVSMPAIQTERCWRNIPASSSNSDGLSTPLHRVFKRFVAFSSSAQTQTVLRSGLVLLHRMSGVSARTRSRSTTSARFVVLLASFSHLPETRALGSQGSRI